ncbi:hypothetical protein B5807_08873 [Epicoccum nigrum]|uniref:Uncharacterized protein n=1 Tax=Epicoccum nigrum TaxID=105696 RepID=A0A1Y2LTJ7_EPING|nr:hypothetical protein B5807_08873 [Epicoccum nigrum]
MNPLPKSSPYAFIPYLPPPPSSSEPPSFNIKHTSTWTYCGPLLTPASLPSSLHTWSAAATTSPSALLSRLIPLLTFLETFLLAAGIDHYWLTLRATTPTSEYDTPRWHVDDDFFAPLSRGTPSLKSVRSLSVLQPRPYKTNRNKKTDWKLCTTLLGPSTLFLPTTANTPALRTLLTTTASEASSRGPHECTSIRCAGCFDTGAAVRARLAVAFKEEEALQAREGEVALFRTGLACGAVHSEPPCGVERVFVNVVPGGEGELRALMQRFGMAFPRAWSLGLPARLDEGDGGGDGDGGEERRGAGGGEDPVKEGGA